MQSPYPYTLVYSKDYLSKSLHICPRWEIILIDRQECADDHRGRPASKLELLPSNSLIQVEPGAPFKTNYIEHIHFTLHLGYIS